MTLETTSYKMGLVGVVLRLFCGCSAVVLGGIVSRNVNQKTKLRDGDKNK